MYTQNKNSFAQVLSPRLPEKLGSQNLSGYFFSEKQLLPDSDHLIISSKTNQHISLTGNFLECHYLHLGGN